MKFSELDSVVLMQDIPAKPDGFSVGVSDGVIRAGAIGVIVHVHTYPDEAYMVEFADNFGQTTAMPTLLPEQIRAVSDSDRRRNQTAGR